MLHTTEAPTLYPSKEEFANPIKYLSSPEITRMGTEFGILKVKPPKNWQPPFSLNPDKFRFHTRLQNLNELSLTNRSRQFWLNGFNNYLRMKGQKQVENGFVKLYYTDIQSFEKRAKRTHLYDIYTEGNPENYSGMFADEELYRNFAKYSSYLKRHLDEEKNDPEQSAKKRQKSFDFEQFDEKKKHTTGCEVCGSKDEPQKILICDDCDKNYHMKCLSPPLKNVPKNDWFCDECLEGSNGDYGFEEDFDSLFTIREFADDCQEFKENYCRKNLNGNMNPSNTTIEKEFWRLVNSEEDDEDEEVQVRYGADIHNEEPDEVSGFPTAGNPNIDPESCKEYLEHPFNLTNLPFAQGSLLNYIKDENREQISGMTVPWLYIGSLFSTFCWHKEDHFTLSANYCHFGATKMWYGIPAQYCDLFEAVCHDVCPDYFTKQPDLLHQLVSLLSPDKIESLVRQKLNKKIKIYHVEQEANEFVITFPKVYHAGFNCGFNVNEAVNFTMPYWLTFGQQSIAEYKLVKKENVFNHYRLLKNILDDFLLHKIPQVVQPGVFSEAEVTGMIRTAFSDYCSEIRSFNSALRSEELVQFLQKLRTRDYKKVLEEKRHRFEENKDSEGQRVLRQSTKMSRKSDESDDLDECICTDCKSFVNFKWVEIDFLRDLELEMSAQIQKADEETDGPDGHEESLLPTPNQSPKVAQEPQFKDIESEFVRIIEEASKKRPASADDESTSSESTGGVRKSRRLAKKSETCTTETGPEAQIVSEMESRLKLLNKMRRKRNRNLRYGKTTLCLSCFEKQLTSTSQLEEKDRIARASTLYTDYEATKLDQYLYNGTLDKALGLKE